MTTIPTYCKAIATLIAVLASLLCYIQTSTVWWAGYDLRNCNGCKPVIDWSDEKKRPNIVTASTKRQFEKDGVVLLQSALSKSKIEELTAEVEDGLSDTFMTTVLTNTVLRQYAKYEHKLDTRSEIIRDWAVHGPLAQWAAELMNASEVRLYNVEKIYSAGSGNPMGCSTAWHRDTVAAPFPPTAKSLTINVYLDDIGADEPRGDVLVYIKGSHNNLEFPPNVAKNLLEPKIKIGDVLVHDPHVYHTPSGRGCWHRRSLQFRYVASPTTFTFEPNRFPHGPVPWTFAHAPRIAPHNLAEGDALEGPWYPKVYPEPLKNEHVPIANGKPWTVFGMLGVAKRALDIASDIGIGTDNCTINGDGEKSSSATAYFAFDGPVTSCNNWKMVNGVPVHKDGQMIKNMERLMGRTAK